MKKLDIEKEPILEAIKDSAGIVSTIAKRLGVDWHTAEKYINEYDECKQALSNESEKVIDLAETKLIGAIQNSDMQTVRWFLATKGKRRGYTDRLELTGADGENIKYDIIFTGTNKDGSPEKLEK